jgi:hypothetical protein
MSLSILSGKSIVWSGVYEIKWYFCIPFVLCRKDTKSLRHGKAPAQKSWGFCAKKEGMPFLTHPHREVLQTKFTVHSSRFTPFLHSIFSLPSTYSLPDFSLISP